MKKTLKLSSILLLTLSLSGCDWFSSSDDTVSTASGSGTTTAATPAATRTSTGSKTENAASYRGKTNGNRPTWYFSKTMRSYPSTFYLTVSGCATDMKISNNGTRWTGSGYTVKQSDVSGRGMAVLAPSSCSSRKARIKY